MSETDKLGSIYRCPQCGGSGNNQDGCASYGPGGMKYDWPPTKCAMCAGSGRVVITPADREK